MLGSWDATHLKLLQMSTRVFALIVGIDEYKSGSIWNLQSCVDDAKNMKRWLMDDLNVPKDQISLLLDRQATKLKIEDTFTQHLVNNPSIERGDAIFIYFAGHGSSLTAPPDWYQDGSKTCAVQVLCPYDHDTKNAQGRITGISDRSLRAMIEQLAAAKGNNITLFLDCCFSPSQTTLNILDRRITRWTPTTKASPDDLYRDIWPGARGSLHVSKLGFYDPDLKSHTTLLACPQGDKALEGKEGGRFTSTFLHTVPQLPLHRTSYSQLFDHLLERAGESQRYLCLGVHKSRVLFDDVPFPADRRLSLATLDSETKLIRVEIGDIHGIVEGSEVSLHLHNRLHSHNPSIASAIVEEVRPSSCLVRAKSHFPTVPKTCWAKISRWNNRRPFRVHLKSTFTTFIRMWKLRGKISSKPGASSSPSGLNVLRVKHPNLADISVTMGRKEATVIQHNPVILDQEQRVVTIQKTDGEEVIDDAARFNLYLSHRNRASPLRSLIQMELYQLDPSSWSKSGVNSLHNATATIPYETGAIYQVLLRNNSKTDLWPYLAYMDPSRYRISMLYHPDASSEEPPLRSRGTLEIGSGKPGSEALSFALADQKHHDYGYLKLFLCSVPVDMRVLEQDPESSFVSDFEIKSATNHRSKPPIWDAMLASVVFIRHPE